jgi:1-acyl-sn-glycerol-3-phosphate acyltransferase
VRALLRLIGKILLPLLARTSIAGRDNIPPTGPLIVAGNHVAAMEVVLMVLVIDRQVEFLGTGDIPPPPLMDAITRLYGYVPIFRGKMDRGAVEQALGVLRQGGVLGVFPEGGIWRTGHKRPQKGVAWLSYRSGAPVLPMGFGGMRGALRAMFRLQRPRLSVDVGPAMPAVHLETGKSRREALTKASQQVLDAIVNLLPVADRPSSCDVAEETFALEVALRDAQGAPVDVPDRLQIRRGYALSRLLHTSALTVVFRDRLHLPVEPFIDPGEGRGAGAIARAAKAVLEYLENDNPYFLTYRFGISEGMAMQDGLQELSALAQWASSCDLSLCLVPVRRFRRNGRAGWMEQRTVDEAHAW